MVILTWWGHKLHSLALFRTGNAPDINLLEYYVKQGWASSTMTLSLIPVNNLSMAL